MDRRRFVATVAAGGAYMAVDQRAAPVAQLDLASGARTLSEHRIASIEARRSNDRYSHFVGRGARGGPTRFGFGREVRILTTDQGAKGGAMSGAKPEDMDRLKGARVSDLYDLAAGTSDEAMSLDLPLHDLAGNILRLPVYKLLGAMGPTHVPIYSSSIHFEDLEPWGQAEGITRLLRECQVDYDLGYRAFKLKIGRGLRCMPKDEGQKRDIEVTRAVRQRFPDCKILVDANNGYEVDDFLNYVTAVADCDLYCIEEPFDENRDDLLKLRNHMRKANCRATIMEGEMRSEAADQAWRYGWYSKRHVERLFALADEGLVDIINMDLAIVGYTRWRRVMPELVEAGLLASPHTWAGTPRPYYCAHLAAGVGNVDIVEGIPGKATGMDYSAYRFEDGKLVVPEEPGFGIKLSL
ncbi:MAG: enolase C-terminal domain-like protein [Armatimonadota bacterium]